MTFCEFEEIINLKDEGKICEAMKQHGFRITSEEYLWEYNFSNLYQNCAYQKKITLRDELKNTDYCADFYKDHSVYTGVTFVFLTIVTRTQEQDRRVSSSKFIFFTDAPYNEEYIKEMNSNTPCDECKNEYIRKHLRSYNGRLLCDNCFSDTLEAEIGIYKLLKDLKK